MPNRKRGYAIHNLMSITVIDDSHPIPGFLPSFETEYENFKSHVVSEPEITFTFGPFTPRNTDCTILDNKFFVKYDYLYCRDSYKHAKWEMELTGVETGAIEIKFSGNFFSKMIISGILLDALINFKLMQAGYCLIHGSGISRADQACIFTGQGGSGKTSLALDACARGNNFLGDNYVILGKEIIMDFITPLNIFSFNYLPLVKKNLNFLKKTELLMKFFLRRISGISVVTKINPVSLGLCVPGKRRHLNTIVLLLPGEQLDITSISTDLLAKHMVNNMRLDLTLANKYFLQYGFVFPESTFGNYWELYESILHQNLTDGISCRRAEVPQKYSQSDFDRMGEATRI